MSSIDLHFLGTGATFPTPERGVSCIGLKSQCGTWLFDCGEGSQIQLQKSTLKSGRITKIFITHLHGDHLFGLPGLMCTLGLQNCNESKHVDLYGPRGLRYFLRVALMLSESFLTYTYSVHELLIGSNKPHLSISETNNEPLHGNEVLGLNISPDENGCFLTCNEKSIKVYAYEISHRVPCAGYIIEEDSIPGKLKVDMLQKKGLQPGPQYGDLKRGLPVTLLSGEVIHPESVTDPKRKGRKIVILGDTSNSENLTKAGRNADVLVHEATYDNSMYEKAVEHGHSTAGMAGAFAQKLQAKKLVLTHFSQRYRSDPSCHENTEDMAVSLLVSEAKQDFPGEVIAVKDLMVVNVALEKRDSA